MRGPNAKDEVVAESGGEVVEDSEDDEWNYFKVESGVSVPVENVTTNNKSISGVAEDLSEEKISMNSPLNPDAAEFIPVSPMSAPGEKYLTETPVKNIPHDLSDIIASSPNWSNMESVTVPEESTFMRDIKSRPSNLFEEAQLSPNNAFSNFNEDSNNQSPNYQIPDYASPPAENDSPKEQSVPEEARGISLANDMISSFIDPSTMSSPNEMMEQHVDVSNVEVNESVVEEKKIPLSQEVPQTQDVEAPESKLLHTESPNLVCYSPTKDVPEPVSPIPSTLKSPEVDRSFSPESEPITEPLVSPVPPTDVHNLTQTQSFAPVATEDLSSQLEKSNESNEKSLPDNEKYLAADKNVESAPVVAGVVAASAAAAATVAATAAAVTDLVNKNEVKDDNKPSQKSVPGRLSTKTTASKPSVTGTKTTTAKKSLAPTPPVKSSATAKTASASPMKTATSRLSTTAKTTSKVSSTLTSSLNKTQVRPKTSTAPPASKSSLSSTATAAKSSSVAGKTAPKAPTSTVPAAKPKPRVSSAPLVKRTAPGLNGETKSTTTIKRTEVTSQTKKPISANTLTTPSRLSSSTRPSTAPTKPGGTARTTLTMVTTTTTSRTLPGKLKTGTSTVTTSTVTTSSRLSSATKKPVLGSDKQAKELANRLTSKSTVSSVKTNGVIPGKTTTTATTLTKTRKSLTSGATPLKTKTNNKTESKAEKIVEKTIETIETMKNESENLLIENNKDINLINSIASE
ncbi:protein p60 precursor, putative [Pediculus humanus corporis]|uniref:Protein p60, putative n=1 Tax=Pediculus humanus subsp. corporis TaxID=121224 RepID=E0VMW8_PEDHC|nr:protein p60 precursor, putative [Pediculus humanus corporis]EEB14724.1 protein p60 precursor, putative [Pediculus humanus corporis]